MAADSYCVTSKYVPEFLHMVIYQMCSTAAFIHLNCNYVFICHSTGHCIAKMQKKKLQVPKFPEEKMEDMACVSSIGAAACWTIPQLDITLNQFTSICGWPASACWLAQLLTRDRKWLPPSPLSGVTGCEDHGEILHYFFACVCVCVSSSSLRPAHLSHFLPPCRQCAVVTRWKHVHRLSRLRTTVAAAGWGRECSCHWKHEHVSDQVRAPVDKAHLGTTLDNSCGSFQGKLSLSICPLPCVNTVNRCIVRLTDQYQQLWNS